MRAPFWANAPWQGPRYRHVAGESKHANIGISLPGTGEAPAAPVFVDARSFAQLRGPGIAADFKALVIDYIDQRYGTARKAAETNERRGADLPSSSPKKSPGGHRGF